MSPQARDATIQHFSKHSARFLDVVSNFATVNNVDVTVFLVSLKAGGVALNLTEASRVYLMDSWWNPAVRPLILDTHYNQVAYHPRLNRSNTVSAIVWPELSSLKVNRRGYGSHSSSRATSACSRN
jgi:hypothetical protein